VVLAGISGAGRPTIDPDTISLRRLDLRGVFGATTAGWARAIELYEDGALRAGHLVTHRFGLAEFERAAEAARDPAAGAIKVLVCQSCTATDAGTASEALVRSD
jgi:threonine dehydrogenase-like Zn-dependent dehydrogenase